MGRSETDAKSRGNCVKKIFSGVVTATLVLLLALTDVAGSLSKVPAAAAADSPAIALNGTVAEGDLGYLNPKSIVLSTGTETKVNYRLVPGYGGQGFARGVTVKIFLPSLEFAEGEYHVVGRDRAPTPLGVQGRVSPGSGWIVKSPSSTVRGGEITLEYDGNLGAGTNPAFDIYLSTYNDGSDGVYGGVPEGTHFELNGYVAYDDFNAAPGSGWETPNQVDNESRVSVITSDLNWDTEIQSYAPGGVSDIVPIWDRYQYIDYLYSLTNTSTNIAANIDGYSITFDIDSTDSTVNGIIPFDINRWRYAEGGPPAANPDRTDTSGQFVGVPGEGGILIYDVTDWDGTSPLTEEIPYTYSGTGMIVVDRETGANQQSLTPEGAPGLTERKYLISLPLSRQGFPNPPTKFKVKAVTDVLFAQTAHWSKTRLAEREIVTPAYAFSFTHATEQREVVYGYDTYNEITDLRSESNAPTFHPTVRYQVDEDFALDRVVYELDESDLGRFENAGITYAYRDEASTELLTETISDSVLERDEQTGVVTLSFDVSALNDLDWDRTFTLGLVDRVEPHAAVPVRIKVFGAPYRVGAMTATATAVFVERFASNDDFGEHTTYTEVPHETALDAAFTVIYPKEVVPSIQVNVDGTANRATVPYDTVSVFDLLFGVNDTTAARSSTTLTLNTAGVEALKDVELTLKRALFAQAENIRASYETHDGEVTSIDLGAYPGDGDFAVAIPAGAIKILIETDALTSNGAVNFASVSARVGDKLATQHVLTGEIRTYQPKPYDKHVTRKATGTIDIQLPKELAPAVDVVGVYGSLKTQNTTHVGYESTFDVEYKLGTSGVNSPVSEYAIDMLPPTKSGALAFNRITLQDAYLEHVSTPTITIYGPLGINWQEFSGTEITADEVTVGSVSKIVISGEDLLLPSLSTIAVVEYDADIELGSSQTLRATFTGAQDPPYETTKSATKSNQITVRETKTQVKVEGVNQVTKPVGAGSEYSVDIYRWWGQGNTYNTKDYTLDQGYKSLGGFTSTITRPSAAYDNNNQTVSLGVELPYRHFDTYYVKIRGELRPYLESVDVYRMVDGSEVLWKSVPGSDWVENSPSGAGFWRINTARPDASGSELFDTYASEDGVVHHPYYKGAWDSDVRPEAPVSRVDLHLNFTRDSNDAAPQLAGVRDDLVEYMGRFHSSSVSGKLPTTLTSTDTIGTDTELTRTASASVNSLVAFPYAQTQTGANDHTSLANKVIPMGNVGEYLASIWNVNRASWSYYNGHGPDIYSPAATEYDEWLGMHDPESFHDQLVYEFTYPASSKVDATYHLDATQFTVANTSTLNSLTGVRVFDDNGGSVEIQFSRILTQEARFVYDHTLDRGIHENGDGTFTVSFGGTGILPTRFEAVFEQIAGFGERTAEIRGAIPDSLGASLAEVDVRIAGVVNGNKPLVGTTKLYRVPDDTRQRTLMHTTSATLTGYTPKLGASLDLAFDSVKVYDYEANGITPNTTRAAVGVENTSEADIRDLVINFKPDANFRSRMLEIPAEIFEQGRSWSVDSVEVTQGANKVQLDLSEFELDATTGNYEFDLVGLFDDLTLATQQVQVTVGSSATLLKRQIDNIAVSFTPKDDSVGLWGSITRGSDPDLPTRMRACAPTCESPGDFFVTGVWVDEDADGSNWNSKPSFVTEQRKSSNEQVSAYSSFNVNAVLASYNPIFVSAGGGNSGAKPTLTLSSHANSSAAPWLYNRVARMQTLAVHLQHDSTRADAANLFYDADTDRQISSTNIAVGDTVKVLYELRNVGVTAAGADAPGSLPIFTPVAHLEAPAHMKISSVEAASDFLVGGSSRPALNRAALIEEITTSTAQVPVQVPASSVIVRTLNDKRVDVKFDMTLNDRESVFFYVEYTATNDTGADPRATQGKTLQWNTYARPAYTHHFMSYDSVGVSGTQTSGTTAAINFDGDTFAEQLGRVYNTQYRFADPNQLRVESRFNAENVSGNEMTLTVRQIRNEILHDNTNLDLFLTLDKSSLSAFELTKFPEPQYPETFVGEFSNPNVFFQDAEGHWVAVEDFDPTQHRMGSINRLWVEYGTVPALAPGSTSVFEAPRFEIEGIGHWKSAGVANTKSSLIASQAQIVLTHKDAAQPVAEYSYRSEASQTAYKALPQIEFNIQSFETRDEALDLYDGAATGKTGYLPGEQVVYRLTAKNHTTYQGTSTNTPYGKAPLLRPVIFDKVPEYLSTALTDHVDASGALDVEAAVRAGDLEIRIVDSATGAARPSRMPTVTVRTEQGLDIAGSQVFKNDRRNDGWGLLSTAEPVNTTVNPAREIDFQVFTYAFDGEQIGRGEQLEIIYTSVARTEDLPVATYPNGKSVFAPFFGWYGNNAPVASTAKNVSMDMASLLHDAGISGDSSHEMTSAEFLSNSFSWQPGANDQRRQPANNPSSQATFYDASANTQRSHTAYLRETSASGGVATNDLYVAFASGGLDENFGFAAKGRVNDQKVPFAERILWAQDGMQLNRAWLYGASEMLPGTKRAARGVDAANFYEHDGSLNEFNAHIHGYTPYTSDDYTYAVQLHEEFTVRLHAANLGDRSIEQGLEYTEILPLGISPYGEDGNLLGIAAFDGAGTPLDSSNVHVEIVQSPESDQGYRAPAQSQEAASYRQETREDMIPFVVRVTVGSSLSGMFNAPASSRADWNQYVDIGVRVAEELAPTYGSSGPDGLGISYWHDQFTLSTVEKEAYAEVYTKEYGAFDFGPDWYNRTTYPNDGMAQGLEVDSLGYNFGSYTSYFAVEPWGKYIRGLNAQATDITAESGKPTLVTGDQLAMRKPTLRVWSIASKDEASYVPDYDRSIQDFSVDLYEEFTINSTVENQQLEVQGEYNRVRSGYDYSSSYTYMNQDIWLNAPQTIGGARGSWFEPTVTIALPSGVAPVLEDGSYARYYADLADQQQVRFTATVNDITFNSSVANRDVTDAFEVSVELIEEPLLGRRFVMHFTVKGEQQADIAYGQSLVISPRVATIDTPAYGLDADDRRYREVLTLANSKRPVFNPIVSKQYETGSVPSLTARDQATPYPYVHSSNGLPITANDRTRRDSASTWTTNSGVLKITERLISATKPYGGDTELVLNDSVDWRVRAARLLPEGFAGKHDKTGAYGGTALNLRKASLTNTTSVAAQADSVEKDLVQVDAAGRYWYVTEVKNAPENNANPYEQIKTTGDVHNSRFVITQFVTKFAEATDEVRIAVGDAVYDRPEFEALGYSITRLIPNELEADEHRNRIQWEVTTPANERGTRGQLRSGESFKMLYEVQLVEGYEDNVALDEEAWSTPELTVDSYVSLVTDDPTLIPKNTPGGQKPEDFIVQSPLSMGYRTFASDSDAALDIDGNGDMRGVYAADTAAIEILKPKAEVRVNTTRPRIAYSNGMSGDTYFNSSDTIEYLITHARITGSGLKELAIEQILPTHETRESTVSVSGQEISATTSYVTSGVWALPQQTLDSLAAQQLSIDDAFKTYVYLSGELAEDGYEAGDWTLLNPAGTSLLTNERFDIPAAQGTRLKKVRVIVRALDPDRNLVPKGTRLDIDADPDTPAKESVLDTDPTNQSISPYPATVTDNAIRLGVQVASNAKSTLFVYDTAQAWGNYVGTSVSKLAQSVTRSYLTPSRPVVNVKYDALYYRSDTTKPIDERFGWSDVTAIAPKSSPHLKFRGEFINADQSMWSRDEDNIYAEDTLMNPFVTFQLPSVMESGGAFTYVPNEEVTAGHPLSDEHRSRYALTNDETNLWTWRLVRADGTEASPKSQLKYTEMYSGPWTGFDRNVVSIWFEGSVFPGDKVVVEFIGSVDAYSPGAAAEDLRSRALVTNNTGLLHPLNSLQNASNRLGYSTDTKDFNRNGQLNDRLVFSEKPLFQYETYDNFGKRKVAYSDLNRAGTVAPEQTPVRQGGEFAFEISVDNSKSASEYPYPYPIMYDVLPFSNDTSITNGGVERNSQFQAWLQPDGMKLEREGADRKVYGAGEYTVYVGPLTRQDGAIVDAEMVKPDDAARESFYDSLGLPGQPSAVRDRHFVALDEVKDNPELLQRARTILVLFNSPDEKLPGQNKLKFTYTMKAPLNAPAFMEQFDDEARKRETSLWNSFIATQRVSRFIPQESNNAGVFVTEKMDNVYLGNYVWNDVNYNGVQDEGNPFVDANGRTHLQPSKDLDFDGTIDDPGINGVKVTLLTAKGFHVDAIGNPIHQVGSDWEVVDESTGASVLDEVFGQPILSEGPLVTVTETDFFGNHGYYTFSNIHPGEYRVMFEFPSQYDRFSATTREVFRQTGVQVFAPGEELDIPAAANDAALVTITDAARVDASTTDAERMSFDMGVAQKVRVGGTIFKEDIDTLDGYQAGPNEPGIAGYHVSVKRMNGETVLDAHGEPMVAITDAQGGYVFDLLPVDREYTFEITDAQGGFNAEMPVTPFVHHIDPFAEANDNDGFTEKGTRTVKTHTLHFDLEGLFETGFADRLSVSVGFYERATHGVIGNRVWNDRNRNGVQDADEPGIAGQELELEQYARVDGEWVRTAYTQSTTSNADGYYYFTRVPSALYEDGELVEVRYQVVVKQLATGYTFAPTRAASGADAHEIDSDFTRNGTMHDTAMVGAHLISIMEEENGVVFGLTDNTIDLGLVAHARSSLSGEVFIDSDGNGIKSMLAEAAERRYTATLEVRVGGDWVEARQDADGRMIEPAKAGTSDAPMRQLSTNAYRFEQLHIIDSEALVPYEYRVSVTQIPLWQSVTKLREGSDPALDNDFTASTRDVFSAAVSESRVLGELQPKPPLLLPIETFVGSPATHVDLGLVPHGTTTTIGDHVWHDLNADGIQDPGEPGVGGLRIVLNRVEGGALVPVAETLTDEDGGYEFTVEVADRDPASAGFNQPYRYVAEFNLTSRQSLSPLTQGSSARNSKFQYLVTDQGARYAHQIVDPVHTAVSEETVLVDADANGYANYESATANDQLDGGIITHRTVRVIGDTVYEDTDSDGAQGADEPGIGGLEAQLFKRNRDTGLYERHVDVDGRSSMTTGPDGAYEFAVEVADLDKDSPHYRLAEEYRVLIKAPANLRLVEKQNVFFYQSSNLVDGIPVEKPYSHVLTEAITLVDTGSTGVDLTTARDVRTADAGFAVYDTSVIIGGRIWEDADSDGLQGEGEEGIPGHAVQLWERIDGDWVRVEDLSGRSTTVTDDDGGYSFTVSPTHYDEDQPDFLAPRDYRVSIEREGHQVWSPLHAGTDRAIDSDVSPAAPGEGSARDGVTQVFSIADLIDPSADPADPRFGKVDVASARDDVRMDIGIKTFLHRSVIGGIVWNDANEDGSRQDGERALSGQRVTLWELVDGDWQVAEDIHGDATRVTDAAGRYEFEVSPANYDELSPDYLSPREYRTTIEVPERYRPSPGRVNTSLDGRQLVSSNAQIVTLEHDGRIVLSTATNDRTLSFPLVEIPIPLGLTGTAPPYALGLGAAALLLGGALLVIGVRRRRGERRVASFDERGMHE